MSPTQTARRGAETGESRVFENVSQLFEIGLRSSEVTAVAALLVALARIVWGVVGWALRVVGFYFSRKIMRYKLDFGPIKNVPKDIEGVYCQIVRYGTDLYIERMASDQERYEGRLQNRVYKLATERNANGALLVRLRLPVHKRIGTQFKVFVRLREGADVDKAEQFLKTLSFIENVKVSQYLSPKKVSFTLAIFPIVETVEGIKNNFFFPV